MSQICYCRSEIGLVSSIQMSEGCGVKARIYMKNLCQLEEQMLRLYCYLKDISFCFYWQLMFIMLWILTPFMKYEYFWPHIYGDYLHWFHMFCIRAECPSAYWIVSILSYSFSLLGSESILCIQHILLSHVHATLRFLDLLPTLYYLCQSCFSLSLF